NTIYASTQTSDSLSTVLFVAAVAIFVRAQTTRRLPAFLLAGLVAGAAMQMRPHMLLLPLWLGGLVWLFARPRPALGHLAIFAAGAFLVLAPWTIRNARLTGRFMPA